MPFRGGEGGSLSDRSEYEFLGLEQGDSDSDDDLEAFVRNARPTSGTSKFPAWPVVLSVVSVLTVLVFLVTAADYFQTDAQPYNPQCLQSFKVARHLGLDSPYPEPKAAPQNSQKCELVHVSLIARGGSTNPTETAVNDLDRLQNWLHANLDSASGAHPAWLEKWKNPYTEEEAGMLSKNGHKLLVEMGKRFRASSERLKKLHKADVLRVRTTQDARSVSSAEAFLEGFFGKNWANSTEIESLEKGNDDVLKYSDRCHVFTDLNSKLTTDSERTKMVLLEKVARRVSRTLDASSSMEAENIMALISACQLDLADQNRDDLFCSLIHPEDWLSLELLREENSPYIRANESYPFLSRPLWEDVLASLDKCTNSAEVKDCALLDIRVGTEGTLLPFLLRLDTEANDVCTGKVSTLAPVSGNVAFELYKGCRATNSSELLVTNKKTTSSNEEYTLKIRVHEQYLDNIPICSMKSYCGLDELKSFFERDFGTSGKKWDEECEAKTSKTGIF